MKHSKNVLVVFLIMLSLVIIPLQTSAMTVFGTFSLAYAESHESKEKYLSEDYPIVEFENHNTSVDGELAASVKKKGLFGYTLKGRLQKSVKNLTYVAYCFPEYGSGTYKAVFVVNQLNGSGRVAGAYNITSSPI